jgi:hypothetical protein
MVFRILNGPYLIQPLKFTTSVSGQSYLALFDQKIFTDSHRGKCQEFKTVTDASLHCSIIENYGVDLILLLIFSTITVVISILLKMKAKSDSTSTITTSDQQVYHSRPKFNISNYGLRWIIFFLSGASYEILTHSMMTLSMGYNSVVMGVSCFLSACFLIYYLAFSYALFKFANPDRQNSQLFQMIRWAYVDVDSSKPRGNYLPLIQLVKAFLQCLFLVGILDSGVAQSIMILLIELSSIIFTIFTAYNRKLDKTFDLVNSSMISFYLFIRCISFANISQEHSQNLGTLLSVVLLLLLIVNLCFAVFALYSEFFKNSEWKNQAVEKPTQPGPMAAVFTEIKEAEAGEKKPLNDRQKGPVEPRAQECLEEGIGSEGDLRVNHIKVSHNIRDN